MIAPPFVAVPPPRYGGTELFLAGLVDGLLAQGHAVTLYASGESTVGSVVRAHYAHPVWPPDPTRELVQAASAVWDILDRREVDIVHAHCGSAVAFAPLLPMPMIYTVHHAREEGVCELLRAANRGGTLTTVAISHRQRVLLGDLPAQVIHHGLPAERYPLGRGDGAYAAFLGRFSPEKGVGEALDAAALAGVPIRLAGRPHAVDAAYFRDEVSPRLEKTGVRWFGEVGPEGKAKLLGSAAATLFPAKWEEPFGLVMIESMLCGTPVIAYGRGSVPEVVDEGVTGFVVDSVEAMAERLARLVVGRPAFDRKRCRAVATARFGLARMVGAYTELYRVAATRPVYAMEAR